MKIQQNSVQIWRTKISFKWFQCLTNKGEEVVVKENVMADIKAFLWLPWARQSKEGGNIRGNVLQSQRSKKRNSPGVPLCAQREMFYTEEPERECSVDTLLLKVMIFFFDFFFTITINKAKLLKDDRRFQVSQVWGGCLLQTAGFSSFPKREMGF